MNITKEQLQKLYWEDGLSTRAIAKKLGCSQPTVRLKMIEFDIPRRTYKDNPANQDHWEDAFELARRAIEEWKVFLKARGLL